jgi:hypothetical protein
VLPLHMACVTIPDRMASRVPKGIKIKGRCYDARFCQDVLTQHL